MDLIIRVVFRFVAYVFFGLTLETIFAVDGIDRALGYPVKRRVPKKYLEGFVSLTMIPLHGFGLLLMFEPMYAAIRGWPFYYRFLLWAATFTVMEALYGMLCYKVLGFYSWDYYQESKYRIFKNGYTLWTLVPMWGIAGLIIERYSDLIIYLSKFVPAFFGL